ncbi:MAG: hypothetical protein WKF77_15885 [Planctomycetaceae bacterium]
MKFSFDDMQHFQKLRIVLPTNAAATAVDLASGFNEQLDQLQKRFDEYFTEPGIETLTTDLKDMEKIGKDRRARKFELVRSFLQCLNARLLINNPIQTALNDALSEARKKLAELQAEFTERFSQSGLSGQALSVAVNNVDQVVKAHEAMERQKHNIGVMSSDHSHLTAGSVQRIHADMMNRFTSWVAAIADIESRPQNPEGPQVQPVWTRREVLTSSQADA